MVRKLPLIFIPITIVALVTTFRIGNVDVFQYATQVAVFLTVSVISLTIFAFKDEIEGRPKGYSTDRRIAGVDYPPNVPKRPRASLVVIVVWTINAGLLLYLSTSFWDWQRFYVYGNAQITWEYVLTIGDGIAILLAVIAVLIVRNVTLVIGQYLKERKDN